MKYDIRSPSIPGKIVSELMRSNVLQSAAPSVKSNRFVSRSKTFSRAAALLVILIGAVAMIGWLSDVATLKSIYGDITMKANTALALMLMGASLWLLRGANHKSARMIGTICAATAALIGFLTLTEHAIGWNLHIDQLLFAEPPGALATTSPGRMGLTASSCFTMFGIAMLLLYRRRGLSFAQGLSIISGFWALLAIIGYAYGAQALFGIDRYTGIALPTAIALFVLCLGILGACLDEGMLSVVCGETAAAIMVRRLAIVAVCVPFALGWLRLAGQRAGYFDLGFGTALSMSSIIMLFLLAIWRAAVRLRRVEQLHLATEAKFERARALLAGIVESSHDAIISKTLDGIITSWNSAAERLYGYSAAEAIGEPITIIIPPERLREERLIQESLGKGGLDPFDTVRLTKSKRRINVSLTVSPIRDQHGRVIGASKSARDITERRNAERERERLLLQERSLRAEAELAARLKDEFLATVSHELRTPLSAILGWSTILSKQPSDPATVDRAIAAIERNAKAQAQLIEDLLDVSRIISGNLRLEVQPIALSSVVKAAMDSVQLAADAKEIQLQIIVNPTADNVRGDAVRLRQVVWNLLSNGIKFTAKGGRVTVKIDRSDSMARVSVTDTGEGIRAEFLPYVFDRFKQADGSITRKHGGLGLGLAIARHLTEMHGGTIEAHSAGEELGAVFTISLPLTAATATAGINSAKSAADTDLAPVENVPDLHGLRVLVVDDAADTREMLRVVLERFGADVTTASSARETLDVLPALQPNVLVSDLGMPDEDGYSLIRKVRALSSDQGGNIPAIALTGYVRVEERMRALDAGYQMFVPKPVEVSELATMIVSLGRVENS